MIKNDTIVAISTPNGLGAVGIVRLSGDNSATIAEKLFSSFSKKSVEDFEPQKMYLGTLLADGISDKCLVVFFKSPHSFTGEDVVEFQCHGGQIILQAIVKSAIKLGARLALNGEFSRRAYLNGKMDLSNVEGMADLINAESEASSKLAFSLFSGGITEKISKLQTELEEAIAYVEAAFDYPEEDVPPMDVPEVRNVLNNQIEELDKLLSTYQTGKSVKEGITVAILGKPNVGKSSLLNAILGLERAIVTDIPGTTRDALSCRYNYKGVNFELFDTAGIRESSDVIEMMGVERARRIFETADICIATFDASKQLDSEDNEIIEKLKGKNSIIVINKTDLADVISDKFPSDLPTLPISAKSNVGIEKLKDKLFEMSNVSKLVSSESVVLTNERHAQALADARVRLATALSILPTMPPDCIIIDIRAAWEKYGELTGATASEHIVDTIFMKLCLGK
ncbi:MAG: tRNA uridine-5-carboxymethylaminomethyl(34) synthesis GTPase MnmE [Clostridia bacterium]